LSTDQSAELNGLGRKRLLALALVVVIVAGGIFYAYSALKPAATLPSPVSPFRYDEVMLENFGLNDFNPNVWNPTDNWTVSHGPSPPNGCYHSSECAWSGPFHAASSQMVLNFSFDRVWLNYSSLLLNFSLWVDTNPGDILYVEYYNNGWNSAAQYSGHLSTSAPLNKTFFSQWILPQLKVPTTTTMMRFRLTGGCCEPLYGGVYVGDLGVYMVGPSSFSRLMVFGMTDQGSISIPVSLDNGPYHNTFTTHASLGLTYLISPGKHTLSVPSTFSEGTTTYTFSSWSDGYNSPSRPCNTPSCGSVQLTAKFSNTA